MKPVQKPVKKIKGTIKPGAFMLTKKKIGHKRAGQTIQVQAMLKRVGL